MKRCTEWRNGHGAIIDNSVNYIDRLAEYEDADEHGVLVRLPCKIGTTVYIVTGCENVYMYEDNDYFSGTGAVTCPYEDDCVFEECDDMNVRVFEDVFTGYTIDNAGIHYCFEHICSWLFEEDCFGKTVFLTRDEAEAALKEG